MRIRTRDIRNLRNKAITVIAAMSALSKWRRRSRAHRVLVPVRRHPIRTVVGAIALGLGVRALMAARQ
jgi:hypothetical protein